MSLEPGQIIEVAYPFFRRLTTLFEADSPIDIETWVPGCEPRQDDDDCDFFADGMGKMTLTIVSLHKPGGFPERVFYTRRWVDPDGKAFGKGKLHIKSKAQFSKLCKGYRHGFYFNDEWMLGAH